jgi:hypothetical protein
MNVYCTAYTGAPIDPDKPSTSAAALNASGPLPKHARLYSTSVGGGATGSAAIDVTDPRVLKLFGDARRRARSAVAAKLVENDSLRCV